MKFSITLLFLFFSYTTFGQKNKSSKNLENEIGTVRYTADSLKGHYIPKDLDDALHSLNKMYSDSTKTAIPKLTEKEYVSKHHRFSIGSWMRNNWQLYEGSRLSKFFENHSITYPKVMSIVILKSYYRFLKNEDIRFEEQRKECFIWEQKVKIAQLKKEKQVLFSKLKIGDTLEFNHNYGFSSKYQKNKQLSNACTAKGVLIQKDKKNLKINVKVLESCDKKGILIHFSPTAVYKKNKKSPKYVSFFSERIFTTTLPPKKPVLYLKKEQSKWFQLNDWTLK